jgi:hypothetical protein
LGKGAKADCPRVKNKLEKPYFEIKHRVYRVIAYKDCLLEMQRGQCEPLLSEHLELFAVEAILKISSLKYLDEVILSPFHSIAKEFANSIKFAENPLFLLSIFVFRSKICGSSRTFKKFVTVCRQDEFIFRMLIDCQKNYTHFKVS